MSESEAPGPYWAAVEGLPAELGFALFTWAQFVMAETPPERPRPPVESPWAVLQQITMGR